MGVKELQEELKRKIEYYKDNEVVTEILKILSHKLYLVGVAHIDDWQKAVIHIQVADKNLSTTEKLQKLYIDCHDCQKIFGAGYFDSLSQSNMVRDLNQFCNDCLKKREEKEEIKCQ